MCCVQVLSQGAFGYLLPIISFLLVWLETWLLDFRVLPQEAVDENSESRVHPFFTAVLFVLLPIPLQYTVISTLVTEV